MADVPQRLVVIGGDAAGMSAASQARRRRGAGDLEIVAFERSHFTSYSACGVPYWIGGLVDGPDELIVRSPEVFRDEYAIDVRLRHEVIGIDLDRREVVARPLDGGEPVRERYDDLVYAAGASPVRPGRAETSADGVFGVQTLDDGGAVIDWLRATRSRAAGWSSAAGTSAWRWPRRWSGTGWRSRSWRVAGADVDGRPGHGRAGPRGFVRDGHRRAQRRTVEELEDEDGRVSAVVTDGGRLAADLVVLGLGYGPTRPSPGGRAAAGRPRGVMTDRRMRVAPGVWAAGDCVETHNRVSGRPAYVPLGTHANKQGRVAGINIGGGYATFPGVVGTAVTKICDLEVSRTGLRAGGGGGRIRVRVGHVRSTTRAGYFPGAESMTVKLIAERQTGRLLGGQIVGRTEAAKRIDVLAVALWHGATVDEMIGYDLGYAPPYAPVWDPVLVAARKAADKVEQAR